MTKLMKHSLLALALVLGSSTYAHAECVTLAHGGTWDAILDFLFPWLANHGPTTNGQPPVNPPGKPPGKPPKNVAPEVDPDIAWTAFALMGGTLMVLGSRRKRQPESI